MKLNFEWKNDGRFHQYCNLCHAETVKVVREEQKIYNYCTSCKHKLERSIVIDPAIEWWIADDGEYWHKSAGIFVKNPKDKFLFFERTVFPFAYTVPAGHVDKDEKPQISASRELFEEVGIQSDTLQEVLTEDIKGDSCRRGSDAHRWHAFVLVLDKEIDVEVKEEGKNPVWLTPEEALQKDLTFPVRHIIEKHGPKLLGSYHP